MLYVWFPGSSAEAFQFRSVKKRRIAVCKIMFELLKACKNEKPKKQTFLLTKICTSFWKFKLQNRANKNTMPCNCFMFLPTRTLWTWELRTRSSTQFCSTSFRLCVPLNCYVEAFSSKDKPRWFIASMEVWESARSVEIHLECFQVQVGSSPFFDLFTDIQDVQ